MLTKFENKYASLLQDLYGIIHNGAATAYVHNVSFELKAGDETPILKGHTLKYDIVLEDLVLLLCSRKCSILCMTTFMAKYGLFSNDLVSYMASLDMLKSKLKSDKVSSISLKVPEFIEQTSSVPVATLSLKDGKLNCEVRQYLVNAVYTVPFVMFQHYALMCIMANELECEVGDLKYTIDGYFIKKSEVQAVTQYLDTYSILSNYVQESGFSDTSVALIQALLLKYNLPLTVDEFVEKVNYSMCSKPIICKVEESDTFKILGYECLVG